MTNPPPIKCGVIGVGYLGNYHAKKYTQLPQATLVGVYDINQVRCHKIASELSTQPYKNLNDLLAQVDAVSIATPTKTHYEISKICLEHGIHVLVEKPITATIEEAEKLVALTNSTDLVLQVGHLERFNSVYCVLTNYIENPVYLESIRNAPFKPRSLDVNVVLDLMIHDIDLVCTIINQPIHHIQATGAKVLTNLLDIANAHIRFANGVVANVTASRVSLEPRRSLNIYQRHDYLTIDLQNKRLAIHRKGENNIAPNIPELITEQQSFEPEDALCDEIKAFLSAITNKTPPLVSGEEGKRALATAHKITEIVYQQLGLFE